MGELIVIKQLPIIEERLHEVKADVESRVKTALSLVVTEENYKDIKKIRTVLTKEFDEFEQQRKEIKKAVSEPYNRFEKVYSECVSELYKKAVNDLKYKIAEVENRLKTEKKEDVETYFNEYKKSIGIDFAEFDKSGIEVNMSISKNKLREQAKSWLDKVSADITFISNRDDSAEVIVEYKKCYDAVKAISEVEERTKEITAIESNKQENEAFSEPDTPLDVPKEMEDDTIYTLSFTVRGTKAQLKELKEFLIRSGMQYE